MFSVKFLTLTGEEKLKQKPHPYLFSHGQPDNNSNDIL